MNIFYLSEHAQIAARMQCDQHVVKMTLESAQMLCTAINVCGGESPYKTTHLNHPCSIWARHNYDNFMWLKRHALELAYEYTRRFGKVHKSQAVIEHCAIEVERVRALFGRGPGNTLRFGPTEGRTKPPLCMPDKYKTDDHVQSYRAYYLGEKRSFARWSKTREAPRWWQDQLIHIYSQ